jgi:hypothetical protein
MPMEDYRIRKPSYSIDFELVLSISSFARSSTRHRHSADTRMIVIAGRAGACRADAAADGATPDRAATLNVPESRLAQHYASAHLLRLIFICRLDMRTISPSDTNK